MIPPKHRGFAILATLAVLAAAAIWFGLPHDREVKNLGVFLLKLVPFVLATEAVARLDPEWARRARLALVALPLAFLVYFLYFVPKIFFFGGENSEAPESFGNLYYHVLTLTPMIILSFVLAFRLGGGAAAWVRRLAYSMLLLMLSGLEDLSFLVTNEHVEPAFQSIPDKWTWASHMEVRLGHVPSKYEAFAFIAVHVALAVFVLASPQRWWEALGRRLSRRGGPAARAEEATAEAKAEDKAEATSPEAAGNLPR